MTKQFFDDHQLIVQYLEGNESALETLIQRHKKRVFSYILFIVKDKQLAEDIFQDTFIKVIKTLRRGDYNEEGKFLPWVVRIAHNLTIDYFRKNKKMPMISIVPQGDDEDFDIFSVIKTTESSVEDLMVKTQIHKDLKKLVYKLPEEQRQVLMMRHYYDMSFKEISDLTNVSINTALGRMRYALINLRKLIEEHQVVLSV